MSLEPESDSSERRIGAFGIPRFATDWDRLLNVYNIQELPVLPADGDPGSEEVPIGVKVLREFFLDAASSHASEIWFDFSPEDEDAVDVCFTPVGKSTTALRIPKSLFFRDDKEMGIFGFLMDRFSDDGMFAISESEFRDKPKTSPFDRRGRIIQPTTPPDAVNRREETPDTMPGLNEVVIIRAFRVSLKGHSIPEDLVVQICPRFWHMPTGLTID